MCASGASPAGLLIDLSLPIYYGDGTHAAESLTYAGTATVASIMPHQDTYPWDPGMFDQQLLAEPGGSPTQVLDRILIRWCVAHEILTRGR